MSKFSQYRFKETTKFFLNLPFGEIKGGDSPKPLKPLKKMRQAMAEQNLERFYKNPYLFNAKELDRETGLYYYGARYYNPKLSMWYGVDPLTEKMPSWSPYTYTFDNPIRYVDPTGMIAEDCPNCPKPSYEGQEMKGYAAIRQAGDKEGNKPLEWVRSREIKGITIKGKAKNTIGKGVSNAFLGFSSQKSWDNYNANRLRYRNMIESSPLAMGVERFENNLWYGVGGLMLFGGTGGFALSGEMTVTAIGGRILTDATIQTAANYTTNGGDLGNALGRVNVTQSLLAGAGMNYIGNSVISSSSILSYDRQATVFNGSIGGKEFATQSVLGIAGGATAKGISGSSAFKSRIIGSYMQTTTRFGQTAGYSVGTVLMNTPDYGTSVIQNKIP